MEGMSVHACAPSACVRPRFLLSRRDLIIVADYFRRQLSCDCEDDANANGVCTMLECLRLMISLSSHDIAMPSLRVLLNVPYP
jgi:hypothetical protein